MPNKKRRNCRGLDHSSIFKPTGTPMKELKITEIEADEFEAMRLCDTEDHDQSDAGVKMGISRGTVQRLLNAGRKKLISALLDANAIHINKTGE